jgi:hypothetical protein
MATQLAELQSKIAGDSKIFTIHSELRVEYYFF